MKKISKRLHQSVTLKSVFAAVFLLLETPYYQSVKLRGGFGHVPLEIPIANELAPSSYQSRMRWLWGGFAEAWGGFGSFWSFKINLGATFGRLWETLGEPLGRLWEALGSFGRRWGSLWGVFGRLWGSFGSLSEPFFSSRLLFLPYI